MYNGMDGNGAVPDSGSISDMHAIEDKEDLIMGCWNETCMVTHLPIFAGDRVVSMIVARTQEEYGMMCYSDSLFQPVGLPFAGEYDDYGSVENIECPEFVRNYILSRTYFCRKDGEFLQTAESGSMEDIMCKNAEDGKAWYPAKFGTLRELLEKVTDDDLWIPCGGGFSKLMLLMAHESAYGELVSFADGDGNSFSRYAGSMLVSAAGEGEGDKAFPKASMTYNLSHNACISLRIDREYDIALSWEVCSKIADGNDAYVKPFVSYMAFRKIMNAGRHGFAGLSGKGSQDCGTEVQMKIAEITLRLGRKINGEMERDGEAD